MAQTYNANRPKGKKAEKPKAFMPEWDVRPQTPDDMLEMVRMLNTMYGGEEIHGNDQ